MPAQRELALDTGPAIYLDHLRYVHPLTDQFRLLLAPAVAWDLRQLPGAPGSSVPDLPGVEIVYPPPSLVEGLGGDASLHPGERETIALAADRDIAAVLDERVGRQHAASRGLRVKGTIGIVVDLHIEGRTRTPLGDDIRRLRDAGMYLGDDLAAWAISQSRGNLPSAPRRSGQRVRRERYRRPVDRGVDRCREP